MRRRPVTLIRLLVLVALGALALPAVARAAGPQPVAWLTRNGSVFWNGGYVENANVPRLGGSDLCGTGGPCFTYLVGVAEPGWRLRVAIDIPARDDSFDVELFDPGGAEVTTASASNQFNAEAFVAHPAIGSWTVRVVPRGATYTSFRMRAKLEGAPPRLPTKRTALLPDLRAVPPYEFGFVAPANPFNALYPPDTINPPLEVAGVHPLSCAADEAAEDQVSRCLRLTSGPMNWGAGPFDVHFDFAGDNAAGRPQTAWQVIHWSDGSTTTRPAGTYSFHKTHAHFHYDGILTYELLRVADPVHGGLTPAGAGHKSGFCPADQLFGQWTKFVQAEQDTFDKGDSTSGNCFSFSNGELGLSTGWGDIYRWQRPGQYVDFASNGDGYYVVRSTVDKQNNLLETNETNNTSYAFIHVVGENVDIVERGLGTDPWDRTKTVVPSLSGPRG